MAGQGRRLASGVFLSTSLYLDKALEASGLLGALLEFLLILIVLAAVGRLEHWWSRRGRRIARVLWRRAGR